MGVQGRIDAADVFTANQRDTRYGGAGGKMFPVLARDFRAAQGAREDGHLHLYLVDDSKGGFRVDRRKRGLVRVRINALGSKCIAHDVEVRVVHRVVFVRPGRDAAKGLRIEKLPAPEGGMEHVTASAAPVHAPAADAGLGGHIPGAVGGLHGFVRIGSL